MKTNMKHSCLVMRQVEHLKGLANCHNLQPLLPELTPRQIRQAIDNLVRNGRIEINGKVMVDSNVGYGKTAKVRIQQYKACPNWEPAQARFQRKPDGAAKAPSSPSKPRSTEAMPTQEHAFVNLRQRKIECLLRLLGECYGLDYDLVVGILADYGHKVPTRAS